MTKNIIYKIQTKMDGFGENIDTPSVFSRILLFKFHILIKPPKIIFKKQK
jgi:hypothetical protein